LYSQVPELNSGVATCHCITGYLSILSDVLEQNQKSDLSRTLKEMA